MARGAIPGASALLSSFEASSRAETGWQLRCCQMLPCSRPGLPLARRASERPCGDVRAFRYLSVVQDLRDVPGDWSFKHVFLGVLARSRPWKRLLRKTCGFHEASEDSLRKTCGFPQLPLEEATCGYPVGGSSPDCGKLLDFGQVSPSTCHGVTQSMGGLGFGA